VAWRDCCWTAAPIRMLPAPAMRLHAAVLRRCTAGQALLAKGANLMQARSGNAGRSMAWITR
jgi:hypothetical protein